MSLNLSAPTVLAFRGIPASQQQSSAHCAYSCQLHLPVLEKCKIPWRQPEPRLSGGEARRLQSFNTHASISAISCVYVGVENLSDIASIFSSSCARLIMASMKLGRSGPNTQDTRTTRCPFSAESIFFSPASFDS